MNNDDTSPRNYGEVLDLLAEGLAADAAVLDYLDAQVKNSAAAFDIVNRLFSNPQFAASVPGLSRLKKLLKQMKDDARRARESADQATESVDRAQQTLEDFVTGDPRAAAAKPFVLYSVRVDPPSNGESGPRIFFNGCRYRFPAKMAETVAALADDPGGSEDHFVPFKPRPVLKKKLRVTTGNLQNRVYRLRKELEERHKLPPGLVEYDPDTKAYRLRVHRREQDDGTNRA